jgi:hypothetical protein
MAPTPGNHGWGNAREGYEPFWRDVTGETPPTYYSFNAGSWEILSVNSEDRRRRATANWLTEQVRPGGNCRIVFMHRPRYSAGRHQGAELLPMRRYWDAIEGRARFWLAGHDHNSQRMHPRDGIVQYIAGAGGRNLYDVEESDRRLAFSNDTNYAALRLDLSPGRARWRLFAVGGNLKDSGSLRCRA